MVEIDAEICNELTGNCCAGETILPGAVIALELVTCDAVRRLLQLLGAPLEGSVQIEF